MEIFDTHTQSVSSPSPLHKSETHAPLEPFLGPHEDIGSLWERVKRWASAIWDLDRGFVWDDDDDDEVLQIFPKRNLIDCLGWTGRGQKWKNENKRKLEKKKRKREKERIKLFYVIF